MNSYGDVFIATVIFIPSGNIAKVAKFNIPFMILPKPLLYFADIYLRPDIIVIFKQIMVNLFGILLSSYLSSPTL